MSSRVVGMFVVALTLVSGQLTSAQPKCVATEWQAFTSRGQPDDVFGQAVAVGGDWLMVGALWDDENGLDAGAVYIYKRLGDGWVPTQKLMVVDEPTVGDGFGADIDIDISGSRAIIGAVGDDEGALNAGAAYIFVEKGGRWTREDKLIASDAGVDALAGLSVAIDGDTAVLGADEASNENGVQAGAAYVFVRSGFTWDEQDRLIAPDGDAGDWFGRVGIAGDTIIVGADQDEEFGTKSGSAYVFVWTGIDWEWVQKLNPDDAMPFAEFGNRIAMSGDRVLIGANTDGNGAGSAYVFRRDGASWVQEDKLLASDGGVDDQFGSGIALFGDLAVIGAKQHTVPGSPLQSGQAYVFRRSGFTWVEQAWLRPSDATLLGHFGRETDISNDGIAVGALFFLDLDAPESGSVYTWGGLDDCNANGLLDLCDIAAGGDANGNGIPDNCECPWDLDGSGDVGIVDFLDLLSHWGTDPGGPPDFDGDGNVGITDFLALLAAWGPCI